MATLQRDLDTTPFVEYLKTMAGTLEKRKQLTLIIEEKTARLADLLESIKADQAELEELNKTTDKFKKLMVNTDFSSSITYLAGFIGEENANNTSKENTDN
jgi:hypothetical protein